MGLSSWKMSHSLLYPIGVGFVCVSRAADAASGWLSLWGWVEFENCRVLWGGWNETRLLLRVCCMLISRWPTESELNGIIGGSLSHNVASEYFLPFKFIFSFSISTLQFLPVYIMTSSLLFLWDSWVYKQMSLCFLSLYLTSFPSVCSVQFLSVNFSFISVYIICFILL